MTDTDYNSRTTLSPSEVNALQARLAEVNGPHLRRFPGGSTERQPVHTVYGGANLYKQGVAKKLGTLAQRSMQEYLPDAAAFSRVFGMPPELATQVYSRVVEKIAREPVEDQRIDFEDGYGYRPDAEEDADAIRCALALAAGMVEGDLPPFTGIRIKSLSNECGGRALRTLDLFLTTLVAETEGQLPANFVVCLPKIVAPEQVSLLHDALLQLEMALGLESGVVKLDLMLETTQLVIAPRGRTKVRHIVDAAGHRCRSVHFGTYDYTAGLDIAAAWQTHAHFAADFARCCLQNALAGTPVQISDGATTTMPIAPHRGDNLSAVQLEENSAAVSAALRLHYNNVQRSLQHGFYQSWDLNPAQLPARYAAVYAFFLSQQADAEARLSSFIDKAAQASLVGSTFDDAASGQGLLNFFLRGLSCGALSEADVLATGLTRDELESRSFQYIVQNRADS